MNGPVPDAEVLNQTNTNKEKILQGFRFEMAW
jgi:hypothetical protein